MDIFEVILGLGSNIGNRAAHLRAAVALLSGCLENIQVSNIFESAALLPEGAPSEWNQPFYNMALTGVTSHNPEELLTIVKSIEEKVGRHMRGHWGPREIDIDILAMDGLVLDSPELTIPHKELLKRDFAFVPLAQIAPEWKYPAPGTYQGQAASDIVANIAFIVNTNLRDLGDRVHV